MIQRTGHSLYKRQIVAVIEKSTLLAPCTLVFGHHLLFVAQVHPTHIAFDQDFMVGIGNFLAEGGKPADLPKQGLKPNLNKRGSIRSIYDGHYKFSRYFSPLGHHTPKTIEQLFANNDVELYDLKNDPFEMNNLAVNLNKYGDIIEMMNTKLNVLIGIEVGEDIGQMLPSAEGENWTSSSISDLRP